MAFLGLEKIINLNHFANSSLIMNFKYGEFPISYSKYLALIHMVLSGKMLFGHVFCISFYRIIKEKQRSD